MKYLIPILLLMTTFTVFSQNQSLPVLKMYKSDKSVITTPLKEIDSLVHVSIVPVNVLKQKFYQKEKALLVKSDIVGAHFKIQRY